MKQRGDVIYEALEKDGLEKERAVSHEPAPLQLRRVARGSFESGSLTSCWAWSSEGCHVQAGLMSPTHLSLGNGSCRAESPSHASIANGSRRPESLSLRIAMDRQPEFDDASTEQEADVIQADGAATIKLSQAWVIQHEKGAWVPETLVKQGIVFVKLQKFQRGFVMFCLGKGMRTAKQGTRSASCSGFDDLLERRNLASQEAAQNALQVEETEPGDSRATRMRKRKIREQDCHLVSPVVEFDLPALEWKSDFFESRRVRALWGITTKDLYLELTVENLLYLRSMVQKGQETFRPRQRSSPKKKGSPKKSSPKRKLKRSQPVSPDTFANVSAVDAERDS